MNTGKGILIAASVLIAATVAVSIIQNPPSLERARRMDQMRVSSLTTLERRVSSYVSQNKKLPVDVQAFCSNCGDDRNDPETQVPYEYRALTDKDYELCAIFATETLRKGQRVTGYQSEWQHEAGRVCFKRTARLQ